jgi:hypothetical protein
MESLQIACCPGSYGAGRFISGPAELLQVPNQVADRLGSRDKI